MRVATWNVNGFRAREAQVTEWVARDRPDVICLQEIKATEEQIGQTLTLLPEYTNYWHGGPKGYSGVSIHVRRDAFADKPQFTHPAFDMESRVVEARLGGGRVVTSVYVPNGGKDFGAKMRFLEAMCAYVEGVHAAGGTLIVCGDLNVARSDADVTPKDRNPGTIGQRRDERDLIERMIASGLQDVLRERDPANESLFTWWAPWRQMRQKNQGWRIDYVLASRGLEATGASVHPEVGTSDHAPVVVDFA